MREERQGAGKKLKNDKLKELEGKEKHKKKKKKRRGSMYR